MDEADDSAALQQRERDFELAREPRSVRVLNEALERWLTARGVSEPVLRAVQVCCDEILANAIHHNGGARDPIRVRIELGTDRLCARFAYRAQDFDPHSSRSPNTHTPISLRDIGGLGIHLLKSLTDRLDYRYRDGHHCLDFEKRYPS